MPKPKLEEMNPPECCIDTPSGTMRDPELVNCKVPFQVEMLEPKGRMDPRAICCTRTMSTCLFNDFQ